MGKRTRAKQCEFGVALFTGALPLPTLSLAGSGTTNVTVTQALPNSDAALAAGDMLVCSAAGADLPAGMVITNVRATAANTVRVQWSALLAISGGGSVTLTFARLRG